MTTTDTETRCTALPKGWAATFCKPMQDAAQYHPTAKAKGIFHAQMINTKTLDLNGTMVAIGSGKYVGRGNMRAMNYCPFCGGQLHDMFKGDVEVRS